MKSAARNLRWADKKGVSIAPGQELELEGAYPTACRNPACVKQFEEDLKAGSIEVVLVTNLTVASSDSGKVLKKASYTVETAPAPVVTESIQEPTKELKEVEHLFTVETPEQVKAAGMKGPMERFAEKHLNTIKLDGEAQKTTAEMDPGEVPLFKDSTKDGVISAPGAANVFTQDDNALTARPAKQEETPATPPKTKRSYKRKTKE